MKRWTVVVFVTLLWLLTMGQEARALGPLVKVCGARELKEVTESVCSTLGKRDTIPFAASLFGQRIRRKFMRVRGSPLSC